MYLIQLIQIPDCISSSIVGKEEMKAQQRFYVTFQFRRICPGTVQL